MIPFEDLWHMQLFCQLPGVVALQISFPFEEILKSFVLPNLSMGADIFDFVFSLAFDEIRWRSREVRTVRVHLDKRS
jgi:hypothetical protein